VILGSQFIEQGRRFSQVVDAEYQQRESGAWFKSAIAVVNVDLRFT
jgi:hypothetical protein